MRDVRLEHAARDIGPAAGFHGNGAGRQICREPGNHLPPHALARDAPAGRVPTGFVNGLRYVPGRPLYLSRLTTAGCFSIGGRVNELG